MEESVGQPVLISVRGWIDVPFDPLHHLRLLYSTNTLHTTRGVRNSVSALILTGLRVLGQENG